MPDIDALKTKDLSETRGDTVEAASPEYARRSTDLAPDQSSGIIKVLETRDFSWTGAEASPEELLSRLIEALRSYRPDADVSMLLKAYEVADRQHKGQKRKSGEPYIIHPLNTAIILAELELDIETLEAALLHDVVEDTGMSVDDLREIFGDEVADLVDGVTKLTQLNLDVDKIELQAENLRKMFFAMAKDIRVVLIKLADRLHNLRTLQYQSGEKQVEKATETMEIYAPLAERLGISRIKVELDDLALKYLKPEIYEELRARTATKREERELFIADIEADILKHLEDAGIEATITGRIKHLFSIYKKMVNQHRSVDEIYDLFAIRILVENVKDCYAALGVIHEMFKPIPGKFKDYIAMPKANMYQSLHTTLIGRDGTPFEVQIRTYEMHKVAEYGIAAHWKYKETGGSDFRADSENDEKMRWLRELLEWQKEADNSEDFLDLVKSDLNLFNESVYCFTPEGDVKELPYGSTPIDFAYCIHSAVGNKMVGARVNERIVPIDYKLMNGDRVEIITSQNSKGPSPDWLSIVRSTSAKSKINAWFRRENKEDNIIRGKEILEKYCHSKGTEYADLLVPEYMDLVMRRYSMPDWDTVLASVGHGGLKEGQVVGKLLDAKRKHDALNRSDEDILRDVSEEVAQGRAGKKAGRGGILVRGVHDISARCAHCCNPVPGDEIVGFVTRGRGITVHRTDCVNMMNLPQSERSRFIDAEWDIETDTEDTYSAELKIYCNNRIGLLSDITRVVSGQNISISSISVKKGKLDKYTIILSIEIHSKDELTRITDKLHGIQSIIDITRTAG